MIGAAAPAFQRHEASMLTAARLTAPADTTPLAFAALVLGAVAMGISPIFVRYAEVGPFASAFWRVALALPALWLWAHLERPKGAKARPDGSAWLSVLLSGLFFTGDLSFWHLAIMHTSVANATFLATLAPVWVVLGSGLFLRERIHVAMLAGLALCLIGAAVLIGSTWEMQRDEVAGDLYALVSSVFFGAYFITVRRARRTFGTGRTVFLSTLVTALLLLVEAMIIEPAMWPVAASGVAALFAVAFVSHAGGQGLLAFALGHLPAAFSSLVILLEGVAAAFFAWLILSEPLGLRQAVGALAIFAGILVARPRHPA
jgi:drug/metabolite transporter (DMT)-like permease